MGEIKGKTEKEDVIRSVIVVKGWGERGKRYGKEVGLGGSRVRVQSLFKKDWYPGDPVKLLK